VQQGFQFYLNGNLFCMTTYLKSEGRMFDKNSTIFNREFRVKRIAEKLTVLQYYLENVTSINLNDGNLMAENFTAGLLNIMFDWELINLNSTRNVVGIDLGDYSNKIAIQVTRDNSRKKIEETIKKFFDHRHDETFDQLYIFILATKKQYRNLFKTQTFSNKIVAKENILDFKDIIALIKNLSIDNLGKIENFLNKELYKFDWEKEAKKIADFINSQHSLMSLHRGALKWDGGVTVVFGNDGYHSIQDDKSPIRRQVYILRTVLKNGRIQELAFVASDNNNTWIMLVDSPAEAELRNLIWRCFLVALEEKTIL
jgi:hypothetical protein